MSMFYCTKNMMGIFRLGAARILNITVLPNVFLNFIIFLSQRF